MKRKALGLWMMIGGALVALTGVGAWLLSKPDVPSGGSSTSVTETTVIPASTTTLPVTTTTTEPATTSTTVPPTTTTTLDADAAIASFVPVFADAIDRQDGDFLFDTLHPAVLALFDEATCRAFIADEILQLGQYRLIGEVDGPTTQLVADMEVEMYQAPVAFVFQGQEFTSEAAFALVEDSVRWFTQCGGL